MGRGLVGAVGGGAHVGLHSNGGYFFDRGRFQIDILTRLYILVFVDFTIVVYKFRNT